MSPINSTSVTTSSFDLSVAPSAVPVVSSVPVKRRRSPLKIALLSIVALVGAFFALCVVMAIVDPPNPEAMAKKAAEEKAAQAQTLAMVNQYAGQWRGQDGTAVIIRGNGGADFDMGNTKVEGGSAHWDAQGKTLTINGLFGIHQTWNIAEPPHQTNEGNTEMTLGGTLYRRMDGFSDR